MKKLHFINIYVMQRTYAAPLFFPFLHTENGGLLFNT